ncbi:MAG: hypothetical protein ACRCYR_14420 [Phycicoccus sp.]
MTWSVPLLTLFLGAAATLVVQERLAMRGARRELRVRYLIEAYRVVESASNEDVVDDSVQRQSGLQSALAGIFLLGTAQQQ